MPNFKSNFLKEQRSEIISLLKGRRSMSTDELAAELNLTKISVRHHLNFLEKEGFICYRAEWQERGRPQHMYFLTEKAEALFPKTYDVLAKNFLKITQQCFGERGLLRVLTNQTEGIAKSFRSHLEGLNFEERVEKLTVLLIEAGYLAECNKMENGSYVLIERNCPIVNVASEFPQICQQEKRLYAEVLGCEVIREQQITTGDHVCSYRILKPIEKG